MPNDPEAPVSNLVKIDLMNDISFDKVTSRYQFSNLKPLANCDYFNVIIPIVGDFEPELPDLPFEVSILGHLLPESSNIPTTKLVTIHLQDSNHKSDCQQELNDNEVKSGGSKSNYRPIMSEKPMRDAEDFPSNYNPMKEKIQRFSPLHTASYNTHSDSHNLDYPEGCETNIKATIELKRLNRFWPWHRPGRSNVRPNY